MRSDVETPVRLFSKFGRFWSGSSCLPPGRLLAPLPGSLLTPLARLLAHSQTPLRARPWAPLARLQMLLLARP